MKNRGGKAFPFRLFLAKKQNEHMEVRKKFIGIQAIALLIILGTFGVFFSLYASNAPKSKPFTFQGQLFGNDNLPVADNTPIPIKFAIYSISSSNANISCLWATGTSANAVDNCPSTNSYTADAQFKTISVTPIRGIFTVEMGDTTLNNMPAIPLDFQTGDYFLQVVVSGEALSPRTRITATPYAYNAQEVAGYAIAGDISGTPTSTGNYISFGSGTFTDSATTANTSAANMAFHTLLQKTLAAQNGAVVTSNAYTLYLEGAPTRAGVNGNTITNAIALGVGGAAVAGGGTITNSYGMYINAQTGATSNYAGVFLGGNVGIGTTTPAYMLDVAASGAGVYQIARLQNNFSPTVNTGAELLFAANRTTSGMTNVAGVAGIITDITTAYTGALAFYTARSTEPAERMRIDHLGNIGINTTNAMTQLHVPGKTPVHLATTSTGGGSSGADDIALQGRYAYLADTGAGKLLVYDISNPGSPLQVASSTTGSSPRDITVQGKYAYLANQSSNQLQIFDISNPTVPTSTGAFTITAPRAVAVQGKYAYVVRIDTSNSMQVIDVSNPSAPTSTGSRSTGDNARAIAVQGRYAYVVTGTGANSFQIYDISNPASTASADGNVANAGFDTLDVVVQGKYAYIALSDGATNIFKIYDISTPSSPTIINGSGTATASRPEKIVIQGRYAYITNFGADGILQIFDISNPTSPTLAWSITQSGSGGFRGIAVQGRFAYISGPVNGDFRVFDLGGAYIQQLETGGLEAGTMDIQTNLTVNNGLTVFGGIHTGMGGIFSAGSLAISASHANAISISPFATSTGSTGEFRFTELTANGSNYVGFKAPDSITTSTVWALPSGDGASGQALKTNGAGVLSWTTLSGGSTPWSTVTGGIYYAGGKIGIGATSMPSALLTLTGGGMMIDGISQIGTWNTNVPLANTITAVDSTGDVGQYVSMTIGTDGLPVLAYYDTTNGDLKVLKCSTVACTGTGTITTIDSSGDVGKYPSIAIGTDEFPVVSYRDSTGNYRLKFIKCGNAACSSGNSTPSVVESPSNWGLFTSTVIGTDGYAVIGETLGTTGGSLSVVKCGDATCTSGNATITSVIPGIDNVYANTGFSITIGTDGFPLISYGSYLGSDGSYDFRIFKCGSAACNSGNTSSTIDTLGTKGGYSSITFGPDFLPVASYYSDTGTPSISLVKCGNLGCSSGNTTTVINSDAWIGNSSIAIGADELPIVSYYMKNTGDFGVQEYDLLITKCGSAACNGNGNTTVTVDSISNVGDFSTIAIGADGLPIIAYYDTTNGDLKVLHCGNDRCIPYWTRR